MSTDSDLPALPEPTRSQKLADAGFTRRPSLWAMQAREALELIAAPRRPDGTWNRDREVCRQIAAEALGRYDDNEPAPPARVVMSDEQIEQVIAAWWRDDLKMKYAELCRAVIAEFCKINGITERMSTGETK